ADAPVAVPDLVGEAEDALDVEVALDRGLDLLEPDAARRGDVADPGGEAGAETGQEQLDRKRPVVGPDEDRRMVRVYDELAHVLLLAARAVEGADGAAGVGSRLPGRRRAEAERGQLALRVHRVDRGEEGGGVDPVEGAALGSGHRRLRHDRFSFPLDAVRGRWRGRHAAPWSRGVPEAGRLGITRAEESGGTPRPPLSGLRPRDIVTHGQAPGSERHHAPPGRGRLGPPGSAGRGVRGGVSAPEGDRAGAPPGLAW